MYTMLWRLFWLACGCEDFEKQERETRQETKQETLLETIKNLMDTMKWTAEQAMTAMKIPDADRGKYIAKL